jgi:hypothetical protein
MEVHKHPHNVLHKKNWSEYLLEFVMVFFAVFLGFLAENVREHIVETKIEKQLINSLINDIKADTARLIAIIETRTQREFRLDSMTGLMNNDHPESHTNEIYFLGISATRSLIFRFLPNDGTVQQLKNSGGFRLIHKRVIADNIAKYDISVRNFLRQEDLEEVMLNDYRQASSKIFSGLVFDQMQDENANIHKLVGIKPALLPYNRADLALWNFRMFAMKTINKANRRDARLLLLQANNLLDILKRKYNL